MLNRTCPVCRQPFTASRSDARYCSGACRVAAARSRDNRDRARLVGALRRLSDAVLAGEPAEALAADARRALEGAA